jgi:nucleotidyltransferase/DNA polymerase involved in DNA repair
VATIKERFKGTEKCGQLRQAATCTQLQQLLGKVSGLKLWHMLHGRDERLVASTGSHQRKSISAEINW